MGHATWKSSCAAVGRKGTTERANAGGIRRNRSSGECGPGEECGSNSSKSVPELSCVVMNNPSILRGQLEERLSSDFEKLKIQMPPQDVGILATQKLNITTFT
ncbi:hypothetical protein RUM44_002148 [Polyplax serrata]|uniref:Uncharacterized protein n=1 Tax=Polyplax serrata TaxID=468196 RepID=A0ABR1AM15_POLSC